MINKNNIGVQSCLGLECDRNLPQAYLVHVLLDDWSGMISVKNSHNELVIGIVITLRALCEVRIR